MSLDTWTRQPWQRERAPGEDPFERAFRRMQKMEIDGVAAEFIDVSPRRERLKDPVPILFVPGLGTPVADYHDAIRGLYESGRRIIAVNHLRAPGGSVLTRVQHKLIEQLKVPSASTSEAQTLLEVLSLMNVNKTDVIAHSAGATNATVMALWQPYRIRNIIFLNPAGIANEPILDQIRGMAQHLGDAGVSLPEVWKRVRERLAGTAAKALGLTRADIIGAFKRLHERGVGIMIGISRDDPIFKAEKMTLSMSDKLEDIDGFFIMPGGHHPAERMDEIESLFGQLENEKRVRAQQKQNRLAEADA